MYCSMCGSEIDIVHRTPLIRIVPRKIDQIVSYMGFGERKGRKEKQGSPMYLRSKVKSDRNITPSSGSTSAATSLILIHENVQPSSVDKLDALIDTGPGHAMSTAS